MSRTTSWCGGNSGTHTNSEVQDSRASLNFPYNGNMANPKRAYSENVPGDFFVDDTCIDCDLCRQIAPAVFREDGDHSIVYRQPEMATESLRAAMALVACPTGSIGTRRKLDFRPAVAAYPELIEDNVYFCGFASPHSYGGS